MDKNDLWANNWIRNLFNKNILTYSGGCALRFENEYLMIGNACCKKCEIEIKGEGIAELSLQLVEIKLIIVLNMF